MVDSRFFAVPAAAPLSAWLEGLEGFEGVEVIGPADRLLCNASEPEEADGESLVLAANKAYAARLSRSKAGAAIVSREFVDRVPVGMVAVVAERPHEIFAGVLTRMFADACRAGAQSVLQSGEFQTEEGVRIGEGAVIGKGAELGRNTVIGANSVIGPGVAIGRNCVIGDNVSIVCAFLGDHVVVHAGVRIGASGFGWLAHGSQNIAVPQLGRVIIQDRVEIGANSTLDRGALADTVIGENTKIDNLVQIGHNCRLGRNCLIAAMSGLSGGTIFGDGVLAGGGVGTSGHLEVGAGSVIHGRAAVTKDWPEGSKLAGAPAQDINGFWRELAALRRLGRGGRRDA